MKRRSGFGYSTDPSTGDPLYIYKPSLAGAPLQFRLSADALEWSAGRYSGRVAYDRIRRVRVSFRPAALQNVRFITEIWPAGAPKLVIASSSWRGVTDQERLDQDYVTFVGELHRRLAVAGGSARYECGAPALLYWPGLAMFVASALAMAGLAVEGLRAVSIPGTLFVIAFLSLFLWQMGRFFRRNRPGTYRPDAPPAELLPTA